MLHKKVDGRPPAVLVVHVTHEDQRVYVQLLLDRNILHVGTSLDVVVKLFQDLLVIEGTEYVQLGNFESPGSLNLVDLLLRGDVSGASQGVQGKPLVGILLYLAGKQSFR